MALQQKLALRQGQGLVMTQQLSQSIKLLALSNIELAAFVEDEMERNPFLEKDSRPDGQNTEKREDPLVSKPSEEKPIEVSQRADLEPSTERLKENLGEGVENEFQDEPDFNVAASDRLNAKDNGGTYIATGGLAVSDVSAYDQQIADYTAARMTLRDHLLSQLTLAGADRTIAAVTADLIDNLDTAGYLRVSLIDVTARLGCTFDQAKAAHDLLRSFDPVGVGAADLADCLRLQLVERNHLDPAMAIVLDNLDLLAKRDFAELKRRTNLDMEDLHDVLREIQALDPKPGTAFEAIPIQHISPDVFLREATDGSWQIELNNETLPRVLINNTYVSEVGTKLNDEGSKDFMAQCLQTASWLTKSLDQRAQTIMKVSREIVKQQDAFFVHGVQHLKPLTLKQLADEIEMHESTVSRVTSNKYMMTPRGLFELKYFFTTAIASTGEGEAHSSMAVREQIKQLIDAETVKTVLSDDAIVLALKSQGIDIARRTIAKYRDAMHIPSSVQRRREKRAIEAAG